jgi:hypothetical protein
LVLGDLLQIITVYVVCQKVLTDQYHIQSTSCRTDTI